MKETLLTQIDKWTSLDFIIFIMNIRGSSLRKLLLLQILHLAEASLTQSDLQQTYHKDNMRLYLSWNSDSSCNVLMSCPDLKPLRHTMLKNNAASAIIKTVDVPRFTVYVLKSLGGPETL